MRYKILAKATKEVAGTRMEMIQLIKDSMSNLLKDQVIVDFEIFGRKKHLYSIYKKMLVKRTSFKQIVDMYGFRIIVPSKNDCYRVLGIVHSLYKPVSILF